MSEAWHSRVHLSVSKVVLHKSIPTQIRHLIGGEVSSGAWRARQPCDWLLCGKESSRRDQSRHQGRNKVPGMKTKDGRSTARKVPLLSDTVYVRISWRKSTLPHVRQLIVNCYLKKYDDDDILWN